MKKLLLALMAGSLVFVGFGCAGQQTTPPESLATKTPVSSNDISALLRENALLMLQAGRVGIDAPKKAEWSKRAQAVSKLMAERKMSEASAELSSLNAEMRNLIAAGQD